MSARFFNMYLTTTISVALVLFLVGVENVILLSTHQLVTDLKEDVALTVMINDSTDSVHVQLLGQLLENADYTHKVHFVSKEQALEEHIATLGEDPVKFLGYNPLLDSYEVYLKADYAQKDSIAQIQQQLTQLPSVEMVNYPQEVVSVFDMHIGKISIAFVAVALVLLIISLVLIVNTIRLHVYSKRFLIKTMRLVGATPWVIRAPFIHRNIRMGFEAGVLALAILAGAVYYIHYSLGVWLFALTWQNIAIVSFNVLAGGVFITFVASLIATGKYIRMQTDKMYEI